MEAGFIKSDEGSLFYVLFKAKKYRSRGSILFAPPFAEEMNKSRRMVALQARRLAENGFNVLVPDLFGCGDSEGDFSEATWRGWKSNLSYCANWLAKHCLENQLVLWGLRTGCLLASDPMFAKQFAVHGYLFWQPILNGDLFLNQFLRLRTSAGLMSGQRESIKDLRHSLACGQQIEVAGYNISPSLFADLSAARLQPPSECPVAWIDIVMDDSPRPSVAVEKIVSDWRALGVSLYHTNTCGGPFWTTQEIIEIPDLLNMTDSLIEMLMQ